MTLMHPKRVFKWLPVLWIIHTNQEVAVTVVERLVHHRQVAQVHVNGDAMSRPRIARSAQRVQALHEVDGVSVGWRYVERRPAHLVRIGRQFVPVGQQMLAALRCRNGGERLVHGRRPDAIQPGARVLGARCGEGGAGQLFGVQTVGALLRRVLRGRQRIRVVRMGGGEVRTEARQILWTASARIWCLWQKYNKFSLYLILGHITEQYLCRRFCKQKTER